MHKQNFDGGNNILLLKHVLRNSESNMW